MKVTYFFSKTISSFRNLLNIKEDTDYVASDLAIRTQTDFKSANAWTLIFAIFIASVGLNVNSTAVIIGAMLISPLMGPIVGFGYGLAIHDFELSKRSIRNLFYAVIISILVSTLFFAISPLEEIQSELLARTTPTFFDVIIAFCGGATGLVALSRFGEKGNAIPGVAIATALMPPLCTVGFGIAHLNWKYALGAFYLFIINALFISVSTYLFTRSLNYPTRDWLPTQIHKKINRYLLQSSLLVAIPSIFLAWHFQMKTSFEIKAKRFIEQEFSPKNYHVVEKTITYSFKMPLIKIVLKNKPLSTIELESKIQKSRIINPKTNLSIEYAL